MIKTSNVFINIENTCNLALFQGTINIDNILSDKYFFYSTVTNLAPQAIQTATATATATEDLTKTVEVEQEPEAQDRQEPTSSTTSSTSTATKSCKKVSKKQQFNIELSERVLNLAEKEDNQVDLELAAIGTRIKRKLNSDEIDDILNEIKEVTKAFFDRKRRRQEIVAVSVQQAAPCVPPNAVIAVPPPPLVRQPQKQVQQVQQHDEQSGGGGGPDVLFDITGMPPMQRYDNLEFVMDIANQNTYMKLN